MGSVMMSGVAPNMTVPVTGIKASDIAVGSIVKLMEGGVATEYLVVNQGIPSGSSLYDASCDGMWLLRKDIKELRQWNSSDVNDYKNSTIHAWLNGDLFNLFGSIEQRAIKQVKIPYVNGTGKSAVASGENGLYSKMFLLSGHEIGITTSVCAYFPVDGAKLDFFDNGGSTGGTSQTKRIAYFDGTAEEWFLRSIHTSVTTTAWYLRPDGSYNDTKCSSSLGIRPALVLPFNAVFDENTLILRGVA